MRAFPLITNQLRWPAGYESLKSVPGAFAAPHAEQMKRNHQQTIEQLAQRGGLSAFELLCAIWKKGLFDFDVIAPEHADARLRVYVEGWQKENE